MTLNTAPLPSATVFAGSEAAVGRTLAAGYEFALNQNWSAVRVEVSRVGALGRGQLSFQLGSPLEIPSGLVDTAL